MINKSSKLSMADPGLFYFTANYGRYSLLICLETLSGSYSSMLKLKRVKVLADLKYFIFQFMHSTEKQKMLNGELYDAADPELVNQRKQARIWIKQFNDAGEEMTGQRMEILHLLIPFQGQQVWIEPPFHCDYGSNIHLGDRVYFNFNCIVLDVMKVSIGHHTLIGPAVQIYTAMHPMNWKERALGPEYAKPVSIGCDGWIGGGTVVCPGVRIGDRCVIGAGSVVTRDIPDDVFAAGNPCRVIRSLI
jgi:maltose O-acetyltransferase